MGIGKVHSWKKVLAQLILLALPTAIFFFYVLWDLNRFYTILENEWQNQGMYFTAGIIFTIVFYAFRFRFVSTIGLLVLINYAIYKYIGGLSTGEFDAFYLSVQYLIFAFLFSLGWLCGFGFSRSKYFTIFWSVFLLVVQIVVVSKTTDIKPGVLINSFAPVLAYAFYIIYTAELIRNMNEDEPSFSWFIIKRLSGFVLVLLLLFMAMLRIFQGDFKTIEKEWGNSQSNSNKKGDSESMTQRDKNGGISNKDQTKLTGSLSKGKQLVFVAKLDNYFDDGVTPNPLYFTSCYYTKFDTLTQAFEIDNAIPHNDLFNPDPSKIPLCFAKEDSSVLRNSLATKNRKVVTADIYKVLLSPNSYLAPSTAFFCQPMSVPKEYRDQYKSSYRAKMWVSDLNSAYFIYNPAGNQMLELFQEQRFRKLKEIKKIKGPDNRFMNYYTYMPADEDYKKITELAKQITVNAKTPVDKIIAIRDYFLSKDEFGQPLFKYSDNPGIPGMPSANKLSYFLLENRKGYCAYYAGATLFMLRSLGIPSRVAAGFLTVDRSSKNPGWYWFYEDQAHAWVQVYFQNYGWIDFDTTVPDVNTQQSDQPDGTPPLNMPQTYLVADGEVQLIDTITKQIKMSVNKLLYHDKDYNTTLPKDLMIDASLATVSTDTGTISLNLIRKGMHITAVSYAEELKNIKASKGDSLGSIIKKLPKIVPVDEIKLVAKEEAEKQKKETEKTEPLPTDWVNIIKIIIGIVAILVVLVFSLPWMIWQLMHSKAKNKGDHNAYYIYRAVTYYMNQLGYYKKDLGPQQYAMFIDQKFGTSFSEFNNVYQKAKYSGASLTSDELKMADEFYHSFITKIKKQFPFKERLSKFLNIHHTIHYFRQPKIN